MGNELDLKNIKGLTEQQAAEQWWLDGPNKLPSAKRRSILAIAWEVVREPMFLLLASDIF